MATLTAPDTEFIRIAKEILGVHEFWKSVDHEWEEFDTICSPRNEEIVCRRLGAMLGLKLTIVNPFSEMGMCCILRAHFATDEEAASFRLKHNLSLTNVRFM